MSAPLLELRSVSKGFDIPSAQRDTLRQTLFGLFRPQKFERLTVLDGVSLDIRQGERVAVMGRNGSGKSTLLKVLCGVYPPDAGQVVRRAALTPILELGVGWNPELDAIDNVLLIGTAMGLSLRQSRAALDEVLAFAGVERFSRLELKYYSSGMAARLAYAVAFQAVREVLVLDEIFAVGDAGFRERCEERFRQLAAEGRTIVFVTHSPQLVEGFCDRAVLLEGGKVALDGAPAKVVAAYLNAVGAQPASPQAVAS